MSLVRTALLSNALFSAATGVMAMAAPERVAGWLGRVPVVEVQVVGLALVVFAFVVARAAREKRPAPGSVFVISAADLVWVAGTGPLLLLLPDRFGGSGRMLMVGVAVAVGALAVLQLVGLASEYAHPDRDGEYSHRLFFDIPTSASANAMWSVVSDLGSVATHSETLRSSNLDGEPGVGAVRQCVDTKGMSWTEHCTQWEPGRSLTLRFETGAPDFPFPFRSMTGGWIVEPLGDASTVRVWWDLMPKTRVGGGLLVAAMAVKAAPGIRRLVGTMARAADGESVRSLESEVSLGALSGRAAR
ncbi:MAG: SRPBCC family protein [Nannocystaceae bacterium]|nr:SRPBCC family protein [Nannocystaceae bacterium]